MPSTLPSRWQEILRQQAAANVGDVLSRARLETESRRLPRWSVPAAVVGFASVSLMSMLGNTEARGRGAVPFDRATLISTRTAGLGASAEDLAPPRREREAIASSSSGVPLAADAQPPVKKRLSHASSRRQLPDAWTATRASSSRPVPQQRRSPTRLPRRSPRSPNPSSSTSARACRLCWPRLW